MSKLIIAALVVVAAASFSQFGGASEPRSPEATLAGTALARAKVAGCDEFRVIETDTFLKRIGVICADGRSHWISNAGPLKVNGQAV